MVRFSASRGFPSDFARPPPLSSLMSRTPRETLSSRGGARLSRLLADVGGEVRELPFRDCGGGSRRAPGLSGRREEGSALLEAEAAL